MGNTRVTTLDDEAAHNDAKVLVVDDDPVIRNFLRRTLAKSGFEVFLAEAGEAALREIQAHDIDVVVVDIELPDVDGLRLMTQLREHDPTVECIIFTGHSTAPIAVDSYAAGAVDFFEKPVADWRRFENAIWRGVRLRRLSQQSFPFAVADRTVDTSVRREVVGSSKAISDLRRAIVALAPRQSAVAIRGAGGVGKTLLALALHEHSGRSGVCEVVSCSALRGPAVYGELFGWCDADGTTRPGVFERCADGTVILDEVADLPLELQGNLLQALDGRPFTRLGGGTPVPLRARIVVTSQLALEQLVEVGRFRADLVARLGIVLTVPDLNARREDIAPLVYHFMRRMQVEEGIEIKKVGPEVLQALTQHDWSGNNVRALKIAVERAVIFSVGDALQSSALPPELRGGPAVAPESPTDRLAERYRGLPYAEFKEALLADHMVLYMRDLLDSTGGNVTQAARLAGLHRPNFRRLMKRFDFAGDDED